jgi:hypothetical protein
VLGLALLAGPAFLFARSAAFAPGPREMQRRSELREGLAWLRANAPSSGPWSHPSARHDWTLLSAPSFGASVAVGARRPVFHAAVPALRQAPDGLQRARQAAALLASVDERAGLEALRVAGVRYLVVAPWMASDPWLVEASRGARGETLFGRLTREGAASPAGLERVWPTPGTAPAGVAGETSIWRVDGGGVERPAPSLRAR